MGCRDRSIDYLKSLGYNVVRFPKADVRPLQLLSRGGAGLDRFGEVTTVLVGDGSVALPPVSDDQSAGDISGMVTSDLKIGLGLSILAGIVSAMGGSSAGLQASYERASMVSFQFEGVLENHVEVAALDRYLASADIDPYSRHAARLLEEDALYVTTSTIKSHRLIVYAKRKDETGIGIDLPVVQEAVGATVKVTAATGTETGLAYDGPVPLVFGFQAVQLFYEQGTYRAIASAQVTMKALSDAPRDGAVRLVSAAPMVRLGDA